MRSGMMNSPLEEKLKYELKQRQLWAYRKDMPEHSQAGKKENVIEATST